MTKFWAICRNTFLQTIRQPIFGILILVTFIILTLDLPLANWAIGGDYHEDNQKLLEQLGLSTLLISGLLQAAFGASSVLAREIEDRTALTVAAKPVPRSTFVLGKFGGVAIAVLLAYYLCSLVFLMTVRHGVRPAVSDPHDWPVIVLGLTAFFLTLVTAFAGNIVFGWDFTSAAIWAALTLMSVTMAAIAVIGKGWHIVPFGLGIRPELLLGMLLTVMAVLVFCAVAVAASTRFGQAMTLLICFGVHGAGLMHPLLFGSWGKDIPLVRALGWLAPNMTYFDSLDALAGDVPIPAEVVGLSALYCGLYVAGVLALGISLFHGRELEARATSSTLPGLVGLLAGAGRLAAIVAAAAAAVLLSLPGFQTASGLGLAGGLAAGGVIGWLLWGAFGRGKRWAWWAVLALVGAAQAGGILLLAGVWRPDALAGRVNQPLRVTGFVLVTAMVLILLSPKTRRHFSLSLPRGRFRRAGSGAAQATATGSTFTR